MLPPAKLTHELFDPPLLRKAESGSQGRNIGSGLCESSEKTRLSMASRLRNLESSMSAVYRLYGWFEPRFRCVSG